MDEKASLLQDINTKNEINEENPPVFTEEEKRKKERKFFIHLSVRILISLIIYVCIGNVYCGFNSLKPILIDQGMFHSLCPKGYPKVNTFFDLKLIKNETCVEQINMMNSVFQVTVSIASGSSWIAGIINDILNRTTFGRYLFYCICAFGSIISSSLFSFFIKYRVLDDYFFWCSHVLYFCSIYFGATLYLVFLRYIYDLPKKYSKIRSYITALFTAAQDLSSFVYFLFFILYFDYRLDIFWMFQVYSITFFVICFVFSFFFQIPKKHLLIFDKEKQEELKTEEITETIVEEEKEQVKQTKCSELSEFLKYLFSPKFLIILFWFSASMLQFTFVFSTIYDQAIELTGDKEVGTLYNSVFSVFLACVGISFSLVFGLILTNVHIAIIFITAMNLLWSIFSFIPVAILQFPMYVYLIIARIFSYMLVFRLMEFYFPQKVFGRMSTIVLTVSGLICILNIPINIFASYVLNNNFYVMNIILGVFGILGNIILNLIHFVDYKNRKNDKNK